MFLQEENIARRAAARLAEELDPDLTAKVEVELSSLRGQQTRTKFDFGVTGAIGLAALIIQIAQFSHDIFVSRRRKKASASEATLKESIRKELEGVKSLSNTQKNRLAEVIAQETSREQS